MRKPLTAWMVWYGDKGDLNLYGSYRTREEAREIAQKLRTKSEVSQVIKMREVTTH